MPAVLHALAQDLADRAGEILGPVRDRSDARRLLREDTEAEHPGLAAGDRNLLVDLALERLAADDFFGWEFVGDPFADDDAPRD